MAVENETAAESPSTFHESAATIATQEGATGRARNDAAPRIARLPEILSEAQRALRATGFAGDAADLQPALITLLALVSRRFTKPISLAIKAPSSAGKSFAVDAALRFFPQDAYVRLTGMSPKYLVYSEEPLSHRMLILCEAEALRNDDVAHMVRVLLSEGEIEYRTVERDEKSGRHGPRTLRKEGPTGLITTTTAVKVHAENETRMFSVPVSDSTEQTRRILISIAARDEDAAPFDWSEWHDLDRWLGSGEIRVEIPYAPQLAKMTNPTAVRLRRDFPAVLEFIRAHALLHRASRERGKSGRVLATIQDYEAIWNLVADIVSDGIGATVSPTVRQTVEAVSSLLEAGGRFHVTAMEVGERLSLDKSSALRRVKTAIEAGYLNNEEQRPYRPHMLVLGHPLPDGSRVLPTPDELRRSVVAEVAQHLEGAESVRSSEAKDAASIGPLPPEGTKKSEFDEREW